MNFSKSSGFGSRTTATSISATTTPSTRAINALAGFGIPSPTQLKAAAKILPYFRRWHTKRNAVRRLCIDGARATPSDQTIKADIALLRYSIFRCAFHRTGGSTGIVDPFWTYYCVVMKFVSAQINAGASAYFTADPSNWLATLLHIACSVLFRPQLKVKRPVNTNSTTSHSIVNTAPQNAVTVSVLVLVNASNTDNAVAKSFAATNAYRNAAALFLLNYDKLVRNATLWEGVYISLQQLKMESTTSTTQGVAAATAAAWQSALINIALQFGEIYCWRWVVGHARYSARTAADNNETEKIRQQVDTSFMLKIFTMCGLPTATLKRMPSTLRYLYENVSNSMAHLPNAIQLRHFVGNVIVLCAEQSKELPGDQTEKLLHYVVSLYCESNSDIGVILVSDALSAQYGRLWTDNNLLQLLLIGPLRRITSDATGRKEDALPIVKTKKNKKGVEEELGFFEKWKLEREQRKLQMLQQEQSFKSATSLLALSQAAVFVTPPFVKLATIFLSVAKRNNLTLLNSLILHSSDLLPALLQYIKSLGVIFAAYVKELHEGAQPNVTLLPHNVVLTLHAVYSLLALVLTSTLIVVTDSEFIDQQTPFPFAVLKCLVEDYNSILYGFAIKQSRSQQSSVDSFMKDEYNLRFYGRQLIKSLIDRNHRTNFVLENIQQKLGKKSDGKAASVAAAAFWLYKNEFDDKLAVVPATPTALRLLYEAPHCIPFAVRVQFLRHMITSDRKRAAMDNIKYGIKVRRNSCLRDGYEQLMKLQSSTEVSFLRARLHVQFEDAHGNEEAGVDAGGVFKEFIEILTKEAFNPKLGLFTSTSVNTLFPNPHAEKIFGSAEECDEAFRFLGRVIAKAVYEGIVVNVPFAHFFLNNVLGRGNSLDDLRLVEPQEYHGLLKLKELDDVTDACIFFCLEEEVLGQTYTFDLIPNGRNVEVTNSNVVKYLNLVAHYKLYTRIQRSTSSFLTGLFEILESAWISHFTSIELQQLIAGGGAGWKLDVDDLIKNVKLVGGYKSTSRTLELLWEVLRDFGDDDQGLFLQFCTGSSRPPLLGFSAMNPPFSIRQTDESSTINFIVDIDRLPSASTCFNLLKLPPYKSKGNLKEKLLQAIRSKSGFELS